jgi:hypothetical protein
MEVWSKLVDNEGHFIPQAETIFRSYLPLCCCMITERSNLVLPTHSLNAVQVCSKLVSNEGHLTLEDKIISSSYLASYWSGVTETSHVALLNMLSKHCRFGWNRSATKSTLLFKSNQFFFSIWWSKSVTNEGHFTLDAERVFDPFLAALCRRVTETTHGFLPAHGLQGVQVW